MQTRVGEELIYFSFLLEGWCAPVSENWGSGGVWRDDIVTNRWLELSLFFSEITLREKVVGYSAG